MRRLYPLVLLALAVGCGDDGPNFDQVRLASLDDLCQSIEGLTGNAILAKRTDSISGTLAYITPEGNAISPTGFAIDLTWPEAPVAVCYPPFVSDDPGAPQAESRVAIEGLTLTFTTEDGQFAERLSAKAWLTSFKGTIIETPTVVAVTRKSGLRGSWESSIELAVDDPTLSIFAQLFGDTADTSNGHIGISLHDPALLEGGVFGSRLAVATWPVARP